MGTLSVCPSVGTVLAGRRCAAGHPRRLRAAPEARVGRGDRRGPGGWAVPQPWWHTPAAARGADASAARDGSANVQPTASRREGRASGGRRWPLRATGPTDVSRGRRQDRHSPGCEAPAGRAWPSLAEVGRTRRGWGQRLRRRPRKEGDPAGSPASPAPERRHAGSPRLSQEEGEGTPTGWLVGPMTPIPQPAASTRPTPHLTNAEPSPQKGREAEAVTGQDGPPRGPGDRWPALGSSGDRLLRRWKSRRLSTREPGDRPPQQSQST